MRGFVFKYRQLFMCLYRIFDVMQFRRKRCSDCTNLIQQNYMRIDLSSVIWQQMKQNSFVVNHIMINQIVCS